MIGRPSRTIGAVLASVWLLGVAAGHASAQGLNQPIIPPRGEWLQVVTATDRWLVLQNEAGQQFPLAYDLARTFVMRWPTSLERIGADCLVEATGLDLGSNRVGVDHIDVYRGPARNLVTPTIRRLIGFNREVTLFDIERQNVLGINWQYLLTPEELRMPARIHAVAPPASVDPLVLNVGGNNILGVAPGPAGMSMTEVTVGIPNLVRPGDVVYLVPWNDRSTERSLAASLVVVFKTVPVEAMVR